MKTTKPILGTILLLLASTEVYGQAIKANLFLRTPQVVNYNINETEISYSPIVSVGAGISHKSKFIELATFINDDNVYGFYTFFGTTIKTKEIAKNFKLHTNWFGEVTYLP
ncbi:MAG: hypothetical protein WBG48_18070, partial [Pricia sp.]